MNKVQAAYQKLGVIPGTSLDAVKRRYKQLVMVWHPDRMPTSEGRRTAEEELKQINHAFDCIKKHFEAEHRQGPGCECQPADSQRTSGGQNQYGHSDGNGQAGRRTGYSNASGYWKSAKTAYEQWREQYQDAERRRRAEEAQEAALKEALEKMRHAAYAAAAAAKAKAKLTNQPFTEQQLRWRIASALAVVFVLLLIGGCLHK